MTYQELLKTIAGRKLGPAYLLYGAEEFLIEDALNKMIDAVVDPGTRDFNFDLFYGGEADVGKIIETANAYPMMAECRLVIVKDLHKLPLAGLEFLAKYLEKPAPTTKMVLISTKLDGRNKAIKTIKSRTEFVEFKPLYERQVPQWIKGYLKTNGYEISEEAILLIQSKVENNIRAIVNELSKIALNLNGKRRIEAADVQSVVSLSKNFSVFDLNDAIGERNLNQSLLILSRILESGESPVGILAMITRHFSSLVKLKGALAQNKSRDEMSALTGIPPFFIEKSIRMAGNYSRDHSQAVFEILLETDVMLKTSQLPPLIALQTLLIKVIQSDCCFR